MTQANANSQSYFPRSNNLPTQSPKYWAKEKDRYIRQLLIGDIQSLTGRPLVTYFSQLDQEINHTDPDDLSEILSGTPQGEVDLMIQTPGGNVDATEKLISVLRQWSTSYRVLVPSWAKSAGTVIALSSVKIVLGMNSELGPIDPQWKLNGNNVPCEVVAADPAIAQHLRTMAGYAAQRMKNLATDILQNGMMHGKDPTEVASVIGKLSSTTGYMSHGAVIDRSEAVGLGLDVEYLEPNDPIWQRIWLLYCLYDYDAKAKNLGKIFEGEKYSIARPK